jgi:hypothetical protein
VIYYTHSTEPDNPFTGLDARVLEEISCGRCLTKALGRSSKFLRQLKINSNWLQTFSDVQQYSEIRMLKSIDKKIDEISTMLDDNIPIIEVCD